MYDEYSGVLFNLVAHFTGIEKVGKVVAYATLGFIADVIERLWSPTANDIRRGREAEAGGLDPAKAQVLSIAAAGHQQAEAVRQREAAENPPSVREGDDAETFLARVREENAAKREDAIERIEAAIQLLKALNGNATINRRQTKLLEEAIRRRVLEPDSE